MGVKPAPRQSNITHASPAPNSHRTPTSHAASHTTRRRDVSTSELCFHHVIACWLCHTTTGSRQLKMVVTEKEIREFETECLAGGQRKGRLRPAHYLPDLATCDQLGRPHVVWLEVGVPAVKNRQRLGLSSDLGPCIKTGQHVVKSSRVGVHMWEDRVSGNMGKNAGSWADYTIENERSRSSERVILV